MSLRDPNWVLFGDVESSYAVDPTIVVADAVLCEEITNNPVAGNFVERNFYRGGLFGARPQVPVNRHQNIQFMCELAGTDEITTPIPPPLVRLLRMCGMVQTLNAGTDVQVAVQPDSSLHESGHIELYNETNQWIYSGSRGSFTLNVPENDYPKVAFNMLSKYTTPAAAAAPGAPDYTLWLPPTAVSEEFTTVFTLDAIAGEMVTSSFDFGAALVPKDRPNVGENIIITDISGTGTISFVMEGIGTKNWVQEAVDNQKLMALQIVQENPAANWRCTIDMPLIQIIGYQNGNVNDEVTEDLNIVIGGDASNNAMTMTFISI